MSPTGQSTGPTPDTRETVSQEPTSGSDIEGQIRSHYRALYRPGDVCELRIPQPFEHVRVGTRSGYVDNEDDFVKLVLPLAMRPDAVAVYATINPVAPALIARAKNRLRNWAKTTTTDKDIGCRRHVLIDIDPTRPAGISATNAERAAALAVACGIADYLRELGFPNPVILGTSGNGATVLYRLDLANDDASTLLVKRFLEGLATRFDTGAVHIDTSVSNAARICKVFGTRACKGDQMEDRPWRRAQATFVDPDAGPLTPEHLASLATSEDVEEPPKTGQTSDGGTTRTTENDNEANVRKIEDAFATMGLQYTSKRKTYGVVFDLAVCPTGDHFPRTGACVTVMQSGAFTFKCHHETCKDKRWPDVAPLLGMGRNDSKHRQDTGGDGSNGTDTGSTGHRAGANGKGPMPETFNSRDLLRREFGAVPFLVPRYLPVGTGVLSGKPKIGKSWLALLLAHRVATGTDLFGEHINPPGRVLYLALEDSPRRIASRLSKIIYGPDGNELPIPADDDDFGIDLSRVDQQQTDQIDFWTRCDTMDNGGLDRIGDWYTTHPTARLVIIDVLQRFRPGSTRGKSAYEQDYAAVSAIQGFATQRGISVLILHHNRKAESDDPLDLVSGTFGLTGAVDHLWIIRRSRGQADAEMYVTGRDVEDDADLALSFDKASAQWHLLGRAEDVRRSKEQREVIDVLRGAKRPLTPSEIARELGVGVNAMYQRLRVLVKHGVLTSDDGKYRLAGT